MATINKNDRWYRAEFAPEAIKRIGSALCATYSRPPDAFGAKGNLQHDKGPHRSRNWILNSPDSARGAADWSLQGTLNKGGDSNWVVGVDFTPGEWGSAHNRALMVQITTRVYRAAKARDPRLSTIRRFAGTLDGRTVVTFECADGTLVAPYDSSHLDHVHGEPWRSLANHDHSGFINIMIGIGGSNMAGEIADAALKTLSGGNALGTVYLRIVQGTEDEKAGAVPLFPHSLKGIHARVVALDLKVEALTAAISSLVQTMQAGNGSVDVAAVLTGVQETVANAVKEIKAEQRDAVADLGEGGATAVRADPDA